MPNPPPKKKKKIIFSDFRLTLLDHITYDQRSQNFYTTRCNGIISHGTPNWGYSGFCWPFTQKQMQTICVHDLCAPYSISRVFIFKLRPQYMCIWWITAILIRKNQNTPTGAPYVRKRLVQVLGSPVFMWYQLKKPALVQFFFQLILKFVFILALKDSSYSIHNLCQMLQLKNIPFRRY